MGGLMSPDHISLASPADVETDTAPRLSLYLYQLNENKHLKNQELLPDDTGRVRYPALPLNLLYLLTAYAQTRETEHQVLGRAMQILHDNAIIRGSLLQGSLSGTFEEIIVTLNPIPLDEMNKLWSMFGSKPYRLSVTYQVSTALVDSTREQVGDRIIRRIVQYNLPQPGA